MNAANTLSLIFSDLVVRYEIILMLHLIWWQLVIFAAGPWVGALMDSMPRVVAFKGLCVLQVGSCRIVCNAL